MNVLNALIFAAFGAVMEVLPEVFPSWFVRTGADCSSARALWLDVMGVVQIGMGLGCIVSAHLAPFAVRFLSTEPARDSGTLALPNPRGVAGR
jgi:hypothetical protein